MAMPSVRLDTAVAGLYHTHGIRGRFLATTYPVFAHMDLHPGFPRETIYPDEEEPFPYSSSEQEKSDLRRILLGLKSVKRAITPGDMDVVFSTPFVENTKGVLCQLP